LGIPVNLTNYRTGLQDIALTCNETVKVGEELVGEAMQMVLLKVD
jgi:hypothetical protein